MDDEYNPMAIKTHIRPELWNAVRETYEAGHYTHAIIEAMHYVSDLLRAKSGVDADGAALVGQALGGDNPRLKLNRLHTESERSIQKGVEQTLRGMYGFIRNPRSHQTTDKSSDSQAEADAIIHFIDYLSKCIDAAKQAFAIPEFLERVFDPHFVRSLEYITLLIEEIPLGKRLDTLIEIYRARARDKSEQVARVVKKLVSLLELQDVDQFVEVVSADLRSVMDDEDILSILEIFPPYLWPKVQRVAKLRIESRLIASINEGEYSEQWGSYPSLGVVAKNLLVHFDASFRVGSVLARKLHSAPRSQQLYVLQNFIDTFGDVITGDREINQSVEGLAHLILDKDQIVMWVLRSMRVQHRQGLSPAWREKLRAKIATFDNPSASDLFEELIGDDIPF